MNLTVCFHDTLVKVGILAKNSHQMDIYFLKGSEICFHVEYAKKINFGDSQKHNIPHCVSPLRAQQCATQD